MSLFLNPNSLRTNIFFLFSESPKDLPKVSGENEQKKNERKRRESISLWRGKSTWQSAIFQRAEIVVVFFGLFLSSKKAFSFVSFTFLPYLTCFPLPGGSCSVLRVYWFYSNLNSSRNWIKTHFTCLKPDCRLVRKVELVGVFFFGWSKKLTQRVGALSALWLWVVGDEHRTLSSNQNVEHVWCVPVQPG